MSNICEGMYLGSLFFPIVLYVCLYANTILSDYCSFVLNFEIRKYDNSNFAVFKIFLAIKDLLRVHEL